MRVEDDLKPHNRETIRRVLEFYKTERKCCAIQATGTGKTFLILRLLEILSDEGKVAVIFAPNGEIIKQTEKRMKKFGLNNAIFYTYQKLAKMSKEEISAIEADLIICDELHRTGAKTWGQKFELLVDSHPDSKVFGTTATPLRCADGRDMAEEYFDGNRACDISLAEALVREIIPVMPLYVSVLYTFEEEYQKMSDKIDKANNSNEEKAELQKELLAAKQRLEKANGVPEIIKKHITNYNGKYLVFCKDKKHLYAMKDVVIGWFREAGYDGIIFEYPYYSDSSFIRKNLENFENNKKEGLKLLFVIDKLNEGLHLDEIQGCLLLRPTRSNITYYQQIGRAIDASSKEKRIIFDLVSNFNSLKKCNLKKELEEKVKERQNGNFLDCSKEFDIDKFNVVDCVQECVDVFTSIDERLLSDDWTKEDIEILANFYPTIGTKVKKMLSQERTIQAIMTKASALRLSFLNAWTREEDDILLKYYPTMGIDIKDMLVNRNKSQIQNRAFYLGIKTSKQWSDEEISILKEKYPIIGIKVKQYIPNRSISSIYLKIQELKLSHNIQWTKEEKEILVRNYPIMGYKCKELLPKRSIAAIQNKCKELNLYYKEKDEQISKCRKSKYKYVYWRKDKQRWQVVFYINGKRNIFGLFKNEDEAGKIAMEKAKEFGKAV